LICKFAGDGAGEVFLREFGHFVFRIDVSIDGGGFEEIARDLVEG